MPHPDAGGDDESHLMDAIYRMAGNRLVTSPDAAGSCNASINMAPRRNHCCLPPDGPDDFRLLMRAWPAIWPEYFAQKLFHFCWNRLMPWRFSPG
jgi:hypothetical protein